MPAAGVAAAEAVSSGMCQHHWWSLGGMAVARTSTQTAA